jgi:hypothetical protein
LSTATRPACSLAKLRTGANAAGSAPGRPEIDEHRHGRRGDGALQAGEVDVLGGAGGVEVGLALAADGLAVRHEQGDPVERAAARAAEV